MGFTLASAVFSLWPAKLALLSTDIVLYSVF